MSKDESRIVEAGKFRTPPRPISPAKMRADIDGLRTMHETLKHCAVVAEQRISHTNEAVDGIIKAVGKIIPMVDQLAERCGRLELFILTQMTITAAQNTGQEIPPAEWEAAQQMLYETLDHWKGVFTNAEERAEEGKQEPVGQVESAESAPTVPATRAEDPGKGSDGQMAVPAVRAGEGIAEEAGGNDQLGQADKGEGGETIQ